MEHVKQALKCLCLAALAAVLWQSVLLVRDARVTVRAVPSEIQATRAALLSEVDRQASGVRADLTGQIGALGKTADARLASIQSLADSHLGRLEQITDSRSAEALGTLAGIRGDIAPTLNNAAALTGNAAKIAASDDIPGVLRDTRFFMARAARTAGHIEQAANAAEKATPEIAASVVDIGKSSDSIAANVAREVDEATKPKKWWQKVLGPVYTAGRLVAAFL